MCIHSWYGVNGVWDLAQQEVIGYDLYSQMAEQSVFMYIFCPPTKKKHAKYVLKIIYFEFRNISVWMTYKLHYQTIYRFIISEDEAGY